METRYCAYPECGKELKNTKKGQMKIKLSSYCTTLCNTRHVEGLYSKPKIKSIEDTMREEDFKDGHEHLKTMFVNDRAQGEIL